MSDSSGSSTATFSGHTVSLPALPWIEGLARRAVAGRLERLADGEIVLVEDGVRRRYGRATGALPSVRVEVADPRFYTSLALRGAVGAGESFIDGDWKCDDLVGLVRVLVRNEEAARGLDGGLAWLANRAERIAHRFRRNSRDGSRRNIAAHYDLGNDFYALFLDPTMTYSAGVFDPPGCSMEQASIAKYDRICRKLELSQSDHLLEIGTGWGGFALHAAGRYGCRVTTTTISREQRELALERVARAGLSDRVEILLEDYRELSGRYDKLASIEMIEAVGHEYLDAFFRTCSERLSPHGLMCLQCITTPDRRYAVSVRSVDFIKRYIFPGGQLVSLGAIAGSTARTGDLRIEHFEDLTPHYAETLHRWRARFHANWQAIRELGYPERFLRMWDFYLASCEGSFLEHYTGSAQLLLAKPRARSGSSGGRARA